MVSGEKPVSHIMVTLVYRWALALRRRDSGSMGYHKSFGALTINSPTLERYKRVLDLRWIASFLSG